ncbi:uncharacterized protein A4U43_C05F1790 [Asparagus officinalis]|uniref:Pre-mRNA polyadenylation factor Fip1 domain-containing protein n=1 Tax=Asparagus officinalis TaxID=4686 RepID=A0A5P1ENM1_ASPOF|nr:uncharacterized protein A4U43_C05F1790 [Asparagus officinalis]
MDDMDDFGDLYGDLDCHVSDKEGDEIKPNPEKPESNRGEETLKSKEAADVEEDECSNSDSDDDDFRIVLNESECPRFQPSKGGVSNGIDEGDDCDKIADHLNNDQRSSDQFPPPPADESMQGMNVDHRSGRHVGSQFKGFLSIARASLSGRGAWDNPLMSCIQGSVSYNRDISVAAQTGVTFCLPRHRTIYDINIEAFEQKPWRHHGVDMTNYFNFDLNEESWKSYCESLNRLRKEAMILNGSPVHHISRLNQGERDSFASEPLKKEGRGLHMPKGRAIQVESSLGERMPSTDKWCPRARDSDVVIQIKMEGSAQDATVFCKNSFDCAENIGASTSGNNSNKRILSPHSDAQICKDSTDSVDKYSSCSDESNDREACRKTKSSVDCEKYEDKDLFKTDACTSGVGSDSGDQIPHHSTSSNLPSRSEESKDVHDVGKDTRLTKKTSVKELQDFIDPDYYLSNDSLSNATESDQEDIKDEARERDLSSGEYNHFSGTRFRSVTALNVSKDDEQTAGLVHRKRQNDMDLGNVRCKTRKQKSSYDADDLKEHLHSYGETKVSLSYKSRRHAVKNGSHKSFTKDSQKCDLVTHSGRNWDEEDCLVQGGCFRERHNEDQRRRCSLRAYPDRPLIENKVLFKENNSCSRMTKERVDEHWTSMEYGYDDLIHDHRYRKHYVQDPHGRHIDFHDVEEEKFDRHFYSTDGEIRSPERSRYYRRLNFEKNRSSKYIQNDAEHHLIDHRYKEPFNTGERDWRDASSSREHSCVSWRPSGRYVNHRSHIRDWQFKNKTNGHAGIMDLHHLSYEDNLEPYEDNLELNMEEYKSEEDVYYENIVSSVQLRRSNRLPKSNLHADDDDSKLKHFEQRSLPAGGRFLLERSLQHDNFQVRKTSLYGRRLLGDRQLNNARKRRVEETSTSDIREHVSILPHVARNELEAVGCRKAVNKHLNGFKGKLARRGIGVTAESKKAIGIGYKDSLVRNSRKVKETYKQEEIYPHISKAAGNHSHQTRLRGYKTKDSLDKLHVPQNDDDNEIEEGELIEESDKRNVVSLKKDWNSGKILEEVGKIADIYDNNRILQTLAKMEKRKERFKEPFASKQGLEKSFGPKNTDPKVGVSVVSDEIKQQRPARKRRWGGN